MALLNILSVAIFLSCVILLRKTGNSSLTMMILSLELVLHQVAAVYFIGWEYGYQYYLFNIAVLVFLGHYRTSLIPFAYAVVSFVAFGWLYYYSQKNAAPFYENLAHMKERLYWTNLSSTVMGLAGISFLYARTAIRMQRMLEEQNQLLKETQLQLVQSEKMGALGKLAAGLAHEMNNPIGAILSANQTGKRAAEKIRQQLTEAAKEEANTKSERLLGALEMTLSGSEQAATRLQELAARLKGFMRVDEAEVKLADLHEGLENTLAMLAADIRGKGIEVQKEYAGDLPKLFCQPAEINQVFMHLLQNSAKAIESDAGRIDIQSGFDSEKITITIKDNGHGLEPEAYAGLFELGFSEGDARVKLGMGLPLSRQIIARHKGRLELTGSPEKGTTATISLPLDNGFTV